MDPDQLSALASTLWWLGGALVFLVGAYWFRRREENAQAVICLLLSLMLVLNWAGVYP